MMQIWDQEVLEVCLPHIADDDKGQGMKNLCFDGWNYHGLMQQIGQDVSLIHSMNQGVKC